MASYDGSNVLLVVVDTLRADHLGASSGVARTPRLDSFAQESVVFSDAISQGSNTINSAPSLLTSTFPSEHGFTNYRLSVAEEHLTLAEILRGEGYETFAVSTNPHVTSRNGLAQGFDVFLDHPTWTDTDAPAVNALFREWLEGRVDEGRPFFAMLWYVDPHTPYEPPDHIAAVLLDPAQRALVSERTIRPGFRNLSDEEKTVTRLLYRGEVEGFDRSFGGLMDDLGDRDLLGDTLVVFTSDHGESFWERNGVDGGPVVGHGISMYRTETWVPFLIRLPDGALSRRHETRVNTFDLVPTVVGALGLEVPDNRFQGRDLMPLIRGESDGTPRSPSVTELLTDFRGSVDIHQESIRTDAGKLVLTHRYRGRDYDPPHVQLLDHRDRPLEGAATELALIRGELLDALARWRLSLAPIPTDRVGNVEREQELIERLRALGYLR